MALKARKRRVFDSVFESTNSVSQPTPDLGFTAPGQPFGGPVLFSHDRSQAPVSDLRDFHPPANPSADIRDQVSFDRSWHEVTSYLSLPQTLDAFDNTAITTTITSAFPAPSPAFYLALRDVLQPELYVPRATQTEDLVSWYSGQVRYHFLHSFLPIFSSVCGKSTPQAVLQHCIKGLGRVHHLYLHGFSFITRHLDDAKPGTSRFFITRFRRDLHAIVSNSVSARVSHAIRGLLIRKINIILEIPFWEREIRTSNERQKPPDAIVREETRRELLELVESLHNVGLGGENFQILFAEIMNESMSYFVQRTYGQAWSGSSSHEDIGFLNLRQPIGGTSVNTIKSQNNSALNPLESSLLPRVVNNSSSSRCVRDLCEWIENKYSCLAVQVLSRLDKIEVAWNDVEKWKEMSIGRLAGLRTKELFDIVVGWPNSNGALDDLRTAITTPQRRLQLTDVFSENLKDRLLHPGASTLQILRTYISMIWSFHSLDHSKVLLDRVAYPLQVYLCSREDAVKIVITGLLSDTKDASGYPIKPGGERLVELAILLNQGSEKLGQRPNEDLDWNDMDWVPDPVDAGPGYRRSKIADVIGTLIGVLGSQEVFIKEFQSIIGENLLKFGGDFEKELKVLELLKTRFGEAPLQSCEVMIKDIQDSRRVDGVIRRSQKLDPSEQEIAEARANPGIAKAGQFDIKAEGLFKPSLHAKILSRLFWPQLHDENYRVPTDIARLQQSYEHGFESLKNSRKLTWLHSLGQATVELEFRDRTIYEEVHTWQATVVWAFQNDEDIESPTRSVVELVENLEMDEALVRSALNFWVGKMVLREFRKDEYAVLETLNQEDLAKSSAQAAAAAAATATENTDGDAALITNDELTSENMQMYWQFIQGMLTNSSPQMPLPQIAMMLKMLIVDGFPYSNEELQEFLGRKVKEGALDFVAGKYKLKK